MNVAYDLELLLKLVPSRDILDFSLGTAGRFFFKWTVGVRVERSKPFHHQDHICLSAD